MYRENKLQEFVPEIAEQMISSCKGLFQGEDGNLDFFGNRLTRKDSPGFSYWVDNYSDSFWKISIIQQCVISALYTLRHIYFQGSITPYSFESYALHVGGSYIRKNYAEDNGRWKTTISSGHSKDNAGKGSDYSGTCHRYGENGKLSEGLRQFFQSNEKQLELQDVPFIGYLYKNRQSLCSIDKMVADSSKIYTSSAYQKKMKSFQLMDYDRKDYYNKADCLLLEYEFERTFHYSLALEVVNLFIEYKDKLGDMGLEEIAKLVAQFPNVFSRRLYLRYMLESIWNDSVDPNYFTRRDNSGRKGMYRVELKMDDLHRRFAWQELARKFCLLISEFVFPICERCFLLFFMDAMKQCLEKEDTDLLLKNGIEVLENFINETSDIMKKNMSAEYPGPYLKEENGFRVLPLEELLSEDISLDKYNRLTKAEKVKCDLLLRVVLLEGGKPCDKTPYRAFDENYFDTRSENNMGVYKRLFGTYMEMKGIY